MPSKPATVQGYVTKIEWTNPHVWFYVDVKQADGSIKTLAGKWARRTVFRLEDGLAPQ